MPALPGVGMEPAAAAASSKPSIEDVLTTPVHAGGADDWTRFDPAADLDELRAFARPPPALERAV